MSSTAGDSHPPPESVHDDENEEERSTDHDDTKIVVDQDEKSTIALQNSVILTKIDLLGLENSGTAVNGGATDVTTGGKSKESVQISPDRMRGGENYRYEEVYDFPPDLSTLNINGRQRFDLVTVRENGRLQIFMVPNRWPQLVRSPLRDGRLRMWLLDDDERGGEQVSPPYDGEDDRKVD
ncbi:hypothetical protein L6452_38274 [Arctium lappa]|uniref:Uncharacterized protein n=1 Tax=Arctium lappa TaxID=4217 RepID=A0ACB8Y5C9_ARCLA|nr:hypothetical protein L6452_38274 [Arctium lappa]